MAKLEILNPLTGHLLHQLENHSAESVSIAVSRAREAQKSWCAETPRERGKVLFWLHDLLLAEEDRMMDIIQSETGKSRAHAFEEIAGSLAAIRYYAKHAPGLLKRKRTNSGVPWLIRTWEERVPVGVVGVITPWNYPLALTMLDVIPALAAGNAVVQKADNQTAQTTKFASELANRAGVPSDAWQVVHGDPATVGNALVDSVDYVAFTGSTATGRMVAERAARRLIGYSLELGGKNPMIVMPEVSVASAVEQAIAAAFGNAGQLCVSIERVYVPIERIAEYEAEFKRQVANLVVSSDRDFSADLGSLTSANQVRRVADFVNEAVAGGGALIAGGTPLPELGPNFYAPTVLSRLPSDSRILRDEVFGPLICIVGYESLADAVRMANDTEYGLNASVLGPERAALAIASQLEAGSVNVNEGYRASMASIDSAMGGMKASGLGRRNGSGGLLRYTEVRTIGVAKTRPLGLPTRGKHYRRMAPLMNRLARVMKRVG